MLYHVTMTHTEDNCPAYDQEEMAQFSAYGDKMEGMAKELNINVLYFLWGAPDHVAYAIIEADDMSALARFCLSIPMRQAFRVTPVQNLKDVMAMGKAMQGQR